MSIEVGKHTFTPNDQTIAYPHDHADPDQIRIAAFGAIRRAAEVARRIERDTTWDDVDDGLGDLITAAGIREAIRAAIGSPKA